MTAKAAFCFEIFLHATVQQKKKITIEVIREFRRLLKIPMEDCNIKTHDVKLTFQKWSVYTLKAKV